MHDQFRSRVGRLAVALVAALLLGACADVAASLPARPSPVPTLARLPTVTPVTPRPTAPPTPTPIAQTTPTVTPLGGTVVTTANVRAGPGVEFAIVGVLEIGTAVALEGRRGEWYQIRAVNGTAGWMAALVLDVAPETAAAVPEA